jgi:uncharacterized protein (DUF305 family)
MFARMQPRRPSYLFVLALLSSFSFAARAEEPAPEPSAAGYEVRFLEGMIDHHAMAVMMGEMCLDMATHEELRAVCASIVSGQSHEITVMQGWLQDWYGISYAPEMKHTGQMKKLAGLEDAEFEIAFMEMMIRHHEAAVREGARCVERAYHDELLELCHQIIEVQTAEIAQMESWLCDWYGECR